MSHHCSVTGALDQYLGGNRFEYRLGLRFSLSPTFVSLYLITGIFLLTSLASFFNLDSFWLHLSAIVEALVVIPRNSNTSSDWGKRVTCHGSKHAYGNNNVNFRLPREQVMHLETAANLCASRRQANKFFAVCSIFELGGVASPRPQLRVSE